MHIGENIRYYRKLLNLTQQQLAAKASISRSYLADVEKNRYNPSLDTLSMLAEALGISTSELLDKQIKTDGLTKASDKSVQGISSSVDSGKDEYDIHKDVQSAITMDIIPERFTDAEEARAYVKKHKIFASEGFDVVKFTDDEILEFANALLDQMKMVSYKYKK